MANILSTTSAAISATLNIAKSYLKCPQEPSLNMLLDGVISSGDQVTPRAQSTTVAIGRSSVIVLSGVLRLREGQHVIYCKNAASKKAVQALINSGYVLLLQRTAEETGQPGEQIYLLPAPNSSMASGNMYGDLKISHIGTLWGNPERSITLTWVEQPMPST